MKMDEICCMNFGGGYGTIKIYAYDGNCGDDYFLEYINDCPNHTERKSATFKYLADALACATMFVFE